MGPGPGALCFEMCLTGTFLEKQNVTSDSHVGSGEAGGVRSPPSDFGPTLTARPPPDF